MSADVSFLVSIGAPEDELPLGYSNVPSKMRLLFGDSESAEDGPTESDVRCLIELAQTLNGSPSKILIHCEAGVSRSTAALIMYTCSLGSDSEPKAMGRLLRQRPLSDAVADFVPPVKTLPITIAAAMVQTAADTQLMK